MSKSVIITETLGGHVHMTFCANEALHSLYMEDYMAREEKVIGVKIGLRDKDYLMLKFEERTRQLKESIDTYDALTKEDNQISDDLMERLKDTLIDSIDMQLNVLLGMLRRKEKKGYVFDVQELIEIADAWIERKDY